MENRQRHPDKYKPCTKEPQFGRVKWSWNFKEKKYMCSVCREFEK